MSVKKTGAITGLRAHTPRLRAAAIRAQDTGWALHLYVTNAPDSGYTDAQVARIVAACALQLQRDVASEYNLPAPTVTFLAAGQAAPVSTAFNEVAVLGIVKHIPRDPTAQGWHQPLGVGAAQGELDGYISTEGLDIDGLSECCGHELLETTVDPGCQAVYVAPDGSQRPQEPGDPLQAGGPNPNSLRVPFDLGDGQPPVMCPNWATRAWGVAGDTSGAKKDYLGLLPTDQDYPIGPYGYVALTSPDGTTTDVFGPQGAKVVLPDEKSHPDARIQFVLTTMRGRADAKAGRTTAPDSART